MTIARGAQRALERTCAEQLNAQQQVAVDHDGGPLLVVAGAGTGKTRMLVARLARLLRDGVPPERVMLATFSRRAASELVRRAGQLADPAAARRVHAGTFHSLAHQVLRRHAAALGLADGFTVIDQADAHDLFSLLRAPAAAATGRRFPRASTLAAIYSRVVSTQVPLAATVARDFPWCAGDVEAVADVFRSYAERKRDRSLLDFEDLLLYWRAAVEDPVTGPVLASGYDHLLVDEYQDTNVVQSDILRGLRRCDPRITVVGDDAQAIYSFRAATVKNILDFAEHFPGSSTVTLERNYRSTGPILDLANAVMESAGKGLPKRLWSECEGGGRPLLLTCADEHAQADAVCTSILELAESGVALHDQAVLFRSSHHSDLLEVEMRRRGIPFVKFGGLRFLEAAHVRDVVAALRVAENPWDELAWHRVLQLAEGVGPATAARAARSLGLGDPQRAGPDPVASFCADPAGHGLPGRAGVELRLIASALGDCRSRSLAPGAQVERIREALEPVLRRRYDRPDARMADLDALARLGAGCPSRADLLAELTLDPPASTGDLAGSPHLDDDWTTLSTVHSAKGGEWTAVHIIHAADGSFPSDMATRDDEGVDEERRLFYVALTRARRHLHIYAPLRYHHGDPAGRSDRHSWAQRTRFLPAEVDPLLEHRAVRSAADAVLPTPAVALTGAVEVSLSGLW